MTWWESLLIAILPALVSGLFSYVLSREKSKKDIQELNEQHKHDLENMKENHKLEIEKIELQQEHEKKMKDQDMASSIGTNVVNAIVTKIMDSPKIQKSLCDDVEKALEQSKKGKIKEQ